MKQWKTITRRMHTMSIFYLLPPRALLGDRFADFLLTIFPGLVWESSSRMNLAEILGNAVSEREDIYVIYRDDLPREGSTAQALVDGFGAEVGDEIVEVRPGSKTGEFISRRWRVA